jgi:TorA maturation chaperone TorD
MPADDATLDDEQVYRASAYSLLAALLRAPPGQELLDYLGQLSPHGDVEPDALLQAMQELAETAPGSDPERLDDEYHALFIGLGRGEVVPFASFYMTGFLMEKPLSDLRADLQRLGYERCENTREPEDHIAAIFEVFSGMMGDRISLDEQSRFFDRHMKPWLGRFFADLGDAPSAEFYKVVARFGAAFIELEQAYLSMQN